MIALTFTVKYYLSPIPERFYLQKSIQVLPLFKCFEALLQAGFLDMCPWKWGTGLQILWIARIWVITLTYAFVLSFLYLLSLGWQLIIPHLNRK